LGGACNARANAGVTSMNCDNQTGTDRCANSLSENFFGFWTNARARSAVRRNPSPNGVHGSSQPNHR
jgi:hypothetical protein